MYSVTWVGEDREINATVRLLVCLEISNQSLDGINSTKHHTDLKGEEREKLLNWFRLLNDNIR